MKYGLLLPRFPHATARQCEGSFSLAAHSPRAARGSRAAEQRYGLAPLIRSPRRRGRARGRDLEAERLGGLEVDNQLELRGLLDWKVAGLGSLENFVHVRGGASANVLNARPIGHKTAASRKTRSS